MMALTLLGFLLIALKDLTPIVKSRSKRTAAAFFLLFIPALILAVLQVRGVQVPSLQLLVEGAFRSLGLHY